MSSKSSSDLRKILRLLTPLALVFDDDCYKALSNKLENKFFDDIATPSITPEKMTGVVILFAAYLSAYSAGYKLGQPACAFPKVLQDCAPRIFAFVTSAMRNAKKLFSFDNIEAVFDLLKNVTPTEKKANLGARRTPVDADPGSMRPLTRAEKVDRGRRRAAAADDAANDEGEE
jgi:hypothetical protein